MKIDETLMYNIAAIAALMASNTILRIALSVKIGDFDFDELKRGLIKYLLTLIAVFFFYIAGQFCPDFKFEINGELVTITTALNIMSLGIIGAYVAKCVANLRDIFSDVNLVLAKMSLKNGGK